MIKVVIVEDSPVVRALLEHILSSEPGIQVIGTADNGAAALELTARKKPDVIVMDIHMPKMDGLEATRRIMATDPIPVIIVSASWNPAEVDKTFLAIAAGAVTALEKPRGVSHPDHEALAKKIVQAVKLMSEVKVVRRRPQTSKAAAGLPDQPGARLQRITGRDIKLVAIGASTGGPKVLSTIFKELPKDFKAPVVVVQHIAAGFLQGLIKWIAQSTKSTVAIATHGEYLMPGHIYFAPDNYHLGVDSSNRVVLSKDEPENGLRPSVSYLLRSVARTFGQKAVGVLLTGMGRDGAEELKSMRERGAITIAQDEASSVVHGMPGQAIKLGAATYVLSPETIAATLISLVS